jgi:ribosomal protein S18 acetylase RimI-like enzyme
VSDLWRSLHLDCEIRSAEESDLETILALQKLAFQQEAELYNDFSIPPLTQTLESIRADFPRKTFLKASISEAIVGSVRGFQEGSTCFVERLVVRPDYQKRGIGKVLMESLEKAFSKAQRFELFTGDRSAGNIRFYEKLGYRIFNHEGILVFLEKTKQ